jgi:carbon-monoxide dehydrogenase medium subunit
MKRLPPFTISQPSSPREASETITSHDGAASFYAGGTELLLAMKEGVLAYEHLVDIKTIPGLDGIRLEDGELWIGAAVTHAQIEHSPLVQERLPALTDVERRVANPRVRATGTLAGNLCFAEPHSDPATLLLCLDARVVIEGATGQRTASLDEFLVSTYETSLNEGELVTHVVIPIPPATWRIAYEKFGIHERPTLGLAVVLGTDATSEMIQAARAAVGCVGPTPRRSAEAERMLAGPIASIDDRLDAAAKALSNDAELIADLDGGIAYKQNLIRVFLGRATHAALS